MMGKIDGNTSTASIGSTCGSVVSGEADGASLMPDPAIAGALQLGDVGATVAALLLRCNQVNHQNALVERENAENRERSEQQQQLHELRERADAIFVTGLTTGLVKASSGALSYAAAGCEARANENAWKADDLSHAAQDASKAGDGGEATRLSIVADLTHAQSLAAKSTQRSLDLGAKLTSASSDFARASGDSASAQQDVRAKECEQAASQASRRVDEAKDKVAQVEKFAHDVIDFLREFERTMDTARSAALHSA